MYPKLLSLHLLRKLECICIRRHACHADLTLHARLLLLKIDIRDLLLLWWKHAHVHILLM